MVDAVNEGLALPTGVAPGEVLLGEESAAELLLRVLPMTVPVRDVPHVLADLADAHVRLYTRRLVSALHGAHGVRVDECQRLKGLWEAVRGKLPERVSALTLREVGEMIDSLESGDYDSLVQAAALRCAASP